MITQLFVNLPVKDLDKSMAFFAKLGFTFNPQFTDEKAACMLIGENIYAMLLVEEFFRTFTRKEIIDARKSTEVILALAADKKERVDELAKLAIEAGGTTPSEPQDLGFMYSRNFQDLDGHLWEVLYMDGSE
jgi:predicted lactoylglutathione lyase